MSEPSGRQPFTIGLVLYDDCDLLDLAGPNEVFPFLDMFYGTTIGRRIRIVTVAQTTPPSTVDAGGLAVTPAYGFDQCPPLDLLFVPGGGPSGLQQTINNPAMLGFLRKAAGDARYVTSVCTGGLLLASAGLLDGHAGTTHWAVMDCLRLFPKIAVPQDFPRWVESDERTAGRGIRITGGGISSSLDASLHMVWRIVLDLTGSEALAEEATRAVQLAIQYHPGPPFTPPPGGDPASVSRLLLASVEARVKPFHDAVHSAVEQRLLTASDGG